MDTQDMHPDPCSRAGLSRARYAGVARTRGVVKSQPGHRICRRCEGERGTGGWSGKWRCRRSRGRLLGRHQWRVWRHGARGSAHEQPDSECVERRTDGSGFRISPFRPVHSGLKLYLLTRRRGAHTAHTQIGRPTHEAPTRENTHKHTQTHSHYIYTEV